MESSDNVKPPSPRCDTEDADADAEDSEDEPIFRFPSLGEFKRKAKDSDDSDGDDSDDAGKGGRNGSDSDDDDDDDDDSPFNSSPESRRRRTTPLGKLNRSGTTIDTAFDILSSDDDNAAPPTPKRRRVPDRAAIEAKAEANVNEFMNAMSDGSPGPQSASRPADREYQRKLQQQMAAASVVDPSGRTGSSRAERHAAMLKASEAAAAASRQAAAERARCELSRKQVKLRVERSKSQRHDFRTKLSTVVGDIANGCRRQRELLLRDEEDAELSLFFEDTLLDGDKSLVDCGITGDTTLRLGVTGEAACFSGPPISLKVRTYGGKTFTVGITMDTTFAAFMEGFNAAVGVPPERAGESVFTFDGDNLTPNGTPEGEDMDSGELIDAKFPADLMNGVQASPTEVKLVTRPKKKQAVGKKAAGATSSARSKTPAATAASAVPLGRAKSTRNKRAVCSGGGGSSSSSSSSNSAVGAQEPEIIVLD